MTRLNRQQIDRVKQMMADQGVHTPELAEDLLDHLCIAIEEEMDKGLSFDMAFKRTFDGLEDDELTLTEMKTQELLGGRKNYYPDLLQSAGLLGLLVLAGIFSALWMYFITTEDAPGWRYPLAIAATNLFVFGSVTAFAIYKIRHSQPAASIFSFTPVAPLTYLLSLAIVVLSMFWTEPLTKWTFIGTNTMEHHLAALLKSGFTIALLAGLFNATLVELLMRGIILKGLLKTSPPLQALLWSSLFSVVMGFFVEPAVVFVIAMIQGWLYWKSKSLYLTIFTSWCGVTIGTTLIFYWDRTEHVVFTWQSLFRNPALYTASLVVSILLTVLSGYYLRKKLSAERQ